MLLKTNAFPERPEILRYWCRLLYLNGRHCLEKPEQTVTALSEPLSELQTVADELHRERELRFPTKAMSPACHQDTHDAPSYKLRGPRKELNMLDHERTGSRIIKGAHNVIHLEASMIHGGASKS